MATIIPRDVNDDELIIRFAFDGDYKRKKPFTEENLDGKGIFFDNRYTLYPVSVYRKLYGNSQDCIDRGKRVFRPENLRSLIVFRKRDFNNAIEKNMSARKEFEADIIGTPLDENSNYIPEEVQVTTETHGNPAHADIRILNPGIIEADSNNANTAIRSFSSILFKNCKVISINESVNLSEDHFNELFPLSE